MIISSQNLRGIFIGFNTLFNKALEEQKTLYERVATVTPSTTDAETYAWLGDVPGMREWIGEREIQNLAGSDYVIKNKDFELTVGVGRNAIEDDKIGLYNPSIQMLGQSAAMHPDELIFELLKNGFTEKCFDGEAFFSASHKIGEKTVSNKGTAKLTLDAYVAARSVIMSLTNNKGRALGLVPNLLVVPPALEGMARSITQSDFINGSTNTMKGTAEALVVSQLAGKDDAWYLLCTTRPIKPLIYQQRKKAKFVSKTAENDDNVFFQKTYLYGADSRGNAGFGFWQMAYGSDGSANA
ncbi:Mu-like prophage major head subunit gpT family protein [[Clostridium] symbiosum]|uniref:Mu-like prophage major head subunit gpT family protein n=1 Tax=Clostridium symbiosum TaxID=1512 RepID=UPI00321913AA